MDHDYGKSLVHARRDHVLAAGFDSADNVCALDVRRNCWSAFDNVWQPYFPLSMAASQVPFAFVFFHSRRRMNYFLLFYNLFSIQYYFFYFKINELEYTASN